MPSDLKSNEQWTVPGLNYILNNVLVGNVRVFGAIEFESDLFFGTPRARCYPFSFDKKWGKNIQVTLDQYIAFILPQDSKMRKLISRHPHYLKHPETS